MNSKSKKRKQGYNPELVAKIKRGEKALKEGKGVVVDLTQLWSDNK